MIARPEKRSWWRRVEAALPFALAAEALAAWSASFQTIVDATLAVAITYQIIVAVRDRGRRTLRAQTAGATFLTGLLAMALCGPRAGLLLMPAGLACVLVSLALRQNEVVRQRASRALRGRRLVPEAPAAEWPRDRAALGLVLPTAALALLLVPIATWTWPKSNDAADPPPQETVPLETPAPAPRHGNPPPPAAHGPKNRGDATSGVGDFEFGAADAALERKVLLEVAPTRAGKSTGDLGALYLRGMPLVDIDGKWSEDLVNAWSVEGRSDGWCWLASRPPASERLDLAVHQEILEFASSGEVVLLCPPGTVSVEAPRVRVVPGGAVLTQIGAAHVGAFDYHVMARFPSRFPAPDAQFATGDPRASATRPSIRAWNDLAAMARTATATATTDLDRVRAVMRFLGEKFKYEHFGAPLDDVAALARFMAVGKGTCLQFAEAGVVMLRSLGVPARVGRGFLVREWDEERELYVVRARDGHAWMEVAFEGCGWVVFDPTPEAPDEHATPRREMDPTVDDPDAAIFGPAGTEVSLNLRRLLDDVQAARNRIAQWIMDNPWPCAAAAVLAALLVARMFRRRARRLTGERVDVSSKRGPWDRLVVDLARRGYRRRPSQTAFEFAASVVASGGDAFKPLIDLTARRQAVRFGGRTTTPADELDVEAFRAGL